MNDESINSQKCLKMVINWKSLWWTMKIMINNTFMEWQKISLQSLNQTAEDRPMI